MAATGSCGRTVAMPIIPPAAGVMVESNSDPDGTALCAADGINKSKTVIAPEPHSNRLIFKKRVFISIPPVFLIEISCTILRHRQVYYSIILINNY